MAYKDPIAAKPKEAARLKRMYYYRKEEGKCITCGGASPFFVRCLSCRRKIWDRRANARIQNRS